MKYRLSPANEPFSQQQSRQRMCLARLDGWLILLLLAMCPLSVWIGGLIGGIDPFPQLGASVMISGFIWLAAFIRYRHHLSDQQKSFLVMGGIILVGWSTLFFTPKQPRSHNDPNHEIRREMLSNRDQK